MTSSFWTNDSNSRTLSSESNISGWKATHLDFCLSIAWISKYQVNLVSNNRRKAKYMLWNYTIEKFEKLLRSVIVQWHEKLFKYDAN
jgi:hypothetical protein